MMKIGIIGSNFGKIGLLPAFNSIMGVRAVLMPEKENWQTFLNNTELNAVALAVPPNIQYQVAKVAIKKGLHIFAEKPLAVNLKQAKELLVLAKKKNITHAIDFMFPEIAQWEKIKQLLDQRKFGKLKHLSVNWEWLSGDIKYKRKSWKTSIKEGGGVLSFYFSHGWYYLESFVGEIKHIETTFTHSKESLNGAEVGVDAKLTFKNNVTGSVHVSCINREHIRHQLIFECEKGTIFLENKNAIVDGFTIKIQTPIGTKEVKIKKDIGKKGEDERVKIVRILAKRFVKACLSKKQMHPSFKEGLRVQKLIAMARRKRI